MPSSSVSISLRKLTGIILLALLFTTVVQAQITPGQDAYTNSADPTTNYGAKTLLDVDGATQITYIQFNLASIPSGASISQATLKLYVNAVTTAGSFNVDYVNGPWTESKITYSLAPALGTAIASNIPLTTASKNQYILINITPAVEAWLSGSQANDGIALVANSTFNASFDSKENTTTSHPAELDIVFAGGGTITGVLTGTGSGLTGGGTSGTLNISLLTSCASGQVLAWNGSAWACSSPSGSGTVTSVGLTAPSTDFIVTGSPVTTSGTLGLGWLVAPDFNDTPNAIVKRDSSGNFSAGTINAATAFNFGGNPFAFGSYANFNAFLGFAGNTTMTGTNNTATGYQALNANTTGNANTAFGVGSLSSNSSGSYNAAFGGGALRLNGAGTYNTAIGGRTLFSATSAVNNTALGNGALYSTTTGGNNTASGYQALYYNQTGSYNTATGGLALQGLPGATGGENTANGYGSLSSTTIGGSNTAVGFAALQANTTGNMNTALGYNAGPDSNSTGLIFATAIGANAVVSESNALVLGGTGVNAVNVGIGTATPAYTLDVQGSGRFTQPVVFASGQTFPGAGTITGVTAGTDLTGGGTSGAVTLNLDTTKVPQLGTANIFTGNQTVNGNVTATNLTATQTVSGGIVNATTSFDLAGVPFDFGSYASQNAFSGFAGNPNSTVNAGQNTAFGYRALYSDVGDTTGDGWFNTAVGDGALSHTNASSGNGTVAYQNTAIGSGAMSNNTTGSWNTAAGSTALAVNTAGNNNTALGADALESNNGSSNTAVGAGALVFNMTGDTNTAIGAGALTNNNSGNNNTALGYSAGPGYPNNLINSTAIGAYAEVDQSNALVLGSILGVNNCTAANGCASTSVGIGTTAPTNVFTIAKGAGQAIADGWTTYSSRRWKTNIQTLHGALGKIEQLRGVSYDLKHSGKHEVGVIAEEVGAVVPEVVSWDKNGKDAQGVDYGRLTALLIEATKEQQTLIHQQQEQIKLQQARIDQLTRQVRQVQSALKTNGRANSALRTVKAQAPVVHQ